MIPLHYLIENKEYSLYTALGKTSVEVYNDFVKIYGSVTITLMHSRTKEKFKITPISHYDVVSKLKMAVDWFYDKKMNDLFLVDERNVLVFNNDYNKLSITIHSSFNQHMEIRPVVNNSTSDRGKEGVIIRINQSGSVIVMNREEFERFYFFLANFSYQTEMQLLLGVLQNIKENEKQTQNDEKTIAPSSLPRANGNPFGI